MNFHYRKKIRAAYTLPTHALKKLFCFDFYSNILLSVMIFSYQKLFNEFSHVNLLDNFKLNNVQ